MEFQLTPVGFEALPGWAGDDPVNLLGPIRRCLEHMRSVKPYKTGSLGIQSKALEDLFERLVASPPGSSMEIRRFLETSLQPFLIRYRDGSRGFVTAFYEPEIEVRASADSQFRYPFYRRPDDLVDLDVNNRPPEIDPSCAFGRKAGGVIDAYPDRSEIESGYLNGRGLEIAWARSRVDVFFAHIQGAARLLYPDGTIRRITYAAKAGHPFTAIGRHLVDIGELSMEDVSMQTIRQWLAIHQDRHDEVLWRNRSFIFFREADVPDAGLGPIAAAKVALEPMRSLAVDRLIHTFSSLFYIDSPSLTHLSGGRPFRQLMMALDTGTAITGAARGDIFIGSGPDAGEMAGNVRNDADFYILVPRGSAAGIAHG